jgi:Transmembrane domain of unknown function (DUF3566)
MARAPEDTAPVDAIVDGSSPNGNGSRAFKSRLPARREKRSRAPKTPKLRPSYERNYRQTIRRVDLWTVLKMSICFYLTALIVVLFAGVVLWWIASAVGIIGNIENFIGDLVNSEDFEFLSWGVLRASTLVGLVLVCLMVVWTVIAAAFYNLFSGILGGIEVTVVEEESIVSK